MRNLYTELKRLVGGKPRQVGDVISVGDVVTVALLGGGEIKVIGVAEVGQRVFIRDGVVEGPAPDLPMELIEI
ncbi:hypothetical protein HNP33_002561 [Comamonas odontotermitis]|uniref:Uncharacterized protein n=1 Tax=Comamonas odontotermitis TaxID=379895 RepID=A0ABR6RH55_9BURK|nr:hypothetical protein [Comamonas odontotermitis]MBB6578479.1 hypothetical protein [Comamonas odontotermitis]